VARRQSPSGPLTSTTTPSSSCSSARTSWPRRISTSSSAARSASSRSISGCWISTARTGLSGSEAKRSGTDPNGNPGIGPANGLPARNRSSSPRRSSTSTIPPTSPFALGSSLGGDLFSSTTGRAPASRSSQASSNPAGPAPTTTTSTLMTIPSPVDPVRLG